MNVVATGAMLLTMLEEYAEKAPYVSVEQTKRLVVQILRDSPTAYQALIANHAGRFKRYCTHYVTLDKDFNGQLELF